MTIYKRPFNYRGEITMTYKVQQMISVEENSLNASYCGELEDKQSQQSLERESKEKFG